MRLHLDYFNLITHEYEINGTDGTDRGCAEKGHQKNTRDEGPVLDAKRLQELKLPTLSYRRKRRDMIEIYKIVTGIYDRDASRFLKLWKDVTPGTGTRGHPFKLYPQQRAS